MYGPLYLVCVRRLPTESGFDVLNLDEHDYDYYVLKVAIVLSLILAVTLTSDRMMDINPFSFIY